ncbi:PRC and DUF2382 domain-containing protein [Kitasatospora sp. NPDC059673]|uniref:PRC and DUF2382 domain-containing protein n=1 Tax=Kitasatospora sp. NPDC059673 TaxID=3346901 RepID=UPI0036CF95F4
MITEEQIRSVLHHPVHDADGNRIGTADHLFLDDATGRPEWVSIKTGRFGSNQSFVPIRDAEMVGDHLQVPYGKDKVRRAPNVDVDSGGHLSEQEERRLFSHYGIEWDDAWKAANEPGEGGWAHRDSGSAATTGRAGGTGRDETTTAATAPTTPTAPTAPPDTPAAGRDTSTRVTATSGAGTTGAAATGVAATGGMAGARTTEARTARDETMARSEERMRGRTGQDEVMTRSEERLHVGVERYETGRARLRKYVVTEEARQTVPIRHEEVRVVREPVTEANRTAAMTSEPIAEAEYDVVLHAERPIVHTEAVPVERVRLVTEEHVEQRTVTGEVRKERIEAELPDGTAARRSMTGEDKGGPAPR